MPRAQARRLEECALNASGAFQSLVYDGWLLGYRKGPSKRLRCVNPFHRSTLPLPVKVEHCLAFYTRAGLPPLFRLLPFSQPSALDRHLAATGWVRFERTLVQHVALAALPAPPLPTVDVAIVPVQQWVETTARLFELDADEVPAARERARTYPQPQAGALVRHDGEPVAAGLVKIESGAAGIFAVNTLPAMRGQGLGRAIVATLLLEGRRLGADRAYLQVTAANAPALALYAHFGFATAYDYWYRGLPGSLR